MAESQERRFGDLTVRIDRGTCIGSGNCMRLAPEVFEFDDSRIITFKPDAPEIEGARLLEACRVCPVDALSVVGPGGEQLVP